MDIKIAGARIHLAGHQHGMSLEEATKALERAGASVVDTPYDRRGPGVDLVVIGPYGAKQNELAHGSAVPVATSVDLRVAIERGFITVRDPADTAPSEDLGQVVRELRAVFDERDYSVVWNRITRELDACKPEHMGDLVAYVSGHTRSWEGRAMGRWSPDEPFEGVRDFVSELPDGDVRVAPPRWVEEMLDGRHGPKHSIVSFLNVQGISYSVEQFENLVFDADAIDDLRGLNLAPDEPTYKRVVEAILTAPSLAGVCELGLGTNVDHLPETYARVTTGLRPDTLIVSSAEHGASAALMLAEVASEVRRLRCTRGNLSIPMLEALARDGACLPALEHLEWTPWGCYDHVEVFLGTGILDRVRSLRFANPAMRDVHLRHLLVHSPVEALETLDLTPRSAYDEPSVEVMERWLLDIVPRADRLRGLERLVLGAYATDPVLEALARFPDLDVVGP